MIRSSTGPAGQGPSQVGLRSFRSFTSQSRTERSPPPEASVLPSGAKRQRPDRAEVAPEPSDDLPVRHVR